MGQLQNQFQQMMGGQSPYSGGGQQQNRRVPWRPQQQGGQGGYSGMPQPQGQQMSLPGWTPPTTGGGPVNPSYSGAPSSTWGGQPINPQRGNQPQARPNNPWSEFEPQKPQQPPMQRGIDGMSGRGVQPTTGQGMQFQPPVQTGGFKPEKGQPQLSGPPMMPPTKQPPTTVPPGTGGIKPQREPVGPPVPSTTPQNPAQQRIDPSRVQASASGTMQGGSVSQPLGQMQPPYRRGYRNPYKQQGGPQQQGLGGEMGPDLGPNYSY